MSSEYHPRLCVLRLTALGDCINAFGLLGALARTYPELELSWVIDERFSSLFCDEQGHDLIPMLKVNFKERGLKLSRPAKNTATIKSVAAKASTSLSPIKYQALKTRTS